MDPRVDTGVLDAPPRPMVSAPPGSVQALRTPPRAVPCLLAVLELEIRKRTCSMALLTRGSFWSMDGCTTRSTCRDGQRARGLPDDTRPGLLTGMFRRGTTPLAGKPLGPPAGAEPTPRDPTGASAAASCPVPHFSRSGGPS